MHSFATDALANGVPYAQVAEGEWVFSFACSPFAHSQEQRCGIRLLVIIAPLNRPRRTVQGFG